MCSIDISNFSNCFSDFTIIPPYRQNLCSLQSTLYLLLRKTNSKSTSRLSVCGYVCVVSSLFPLKFTDSTWYCFLPGARGLLGRRLCLHSRSCTLHSCSPRGDFLLTLSGLWTHCDIKHQVTCVQCRHTKLSCTNWPTCTWQTVGTSKWVTSRFITALMGWLWEHWFTFHKSCLCDIRDKLCCFTCTWLFFVVLWM